MYCERKQLSCMEYLLVVSDEPRFGKTVNGEIFKWTIFQSLCYHDMNLPTEESVSSQAHLQPILLYGPIDYQVQN